MPRLPVQVLNLISNFARAENSAIGAHLRTGSSGSRIIFRSDIVRIGRGRGYGTTAGASDSPRAKDELESGSGDRDGVSGAIDESVKPYYVTTPIFYVNASPHIGHLHSLLLTDLLSRFHALRYPSHPHRFATGTDEHGLKIQKAAESAGKDPQEFVDEVSGRFRRLVDVAKVGNTDFVRTSGEEHKEAVRYFWNTLLQSGHIYKGSHSGWYAVSDECFYTGTQVEDRVQEDGSGEVVKVAIESGSPVEWTEEENYKFRLSAFQQPLIDWLKANAKAVHPPSLHATLLNSLLTQPLQDLSISRPRSRLTWGVPVPGDENEHTIYVWVDALVNYLTVLGYPWKDESGNVASPEEQGVLGLKAGWPVDVHVVGKDIVRFHAIYWPALLLAAGLSPPTQVLSHAHWTQGRTKMSKSKGNVVDPFVAMEDGPGLVGREGVRWYLMKAGGSLERDADYSDEQLVTHYNLLASQIGNLLNRISNPKLLSRYLEASAAAATMESTSSTFEADKLVAFERSLMEIGPSFEARMEGVEVTRALEDVMEVVAEANKTFTHLAPWRPSATASEITRSINLTHEALRRAGVLLSIVMPEKMSQLLDRLGVPEGRRRWADLRDLLERDEMDVAVSKMVLRQKAAKGEAVLFPPLSAL